MEGTRKKRSARQAGTWHGSGSCQGPRRARQAGWTGKESREQSHGQAGWLRDPEEDGHLRSQSVFRCQ